MSIPRFFFRVGDALTPLLRNSIGLEKFLAETSVSLEAPPGIEEHPAQLAGFLLTANICARTYPRLRFIAPPRLLDECASLALKINPLCDVDKGGGSESTSLYWGGAKASAATVAIAPVGWDVMINSQNLSGLQPANALTSMAAGAIGANEIFRRVFANFLPSSTHKETTSGFNILTLAGPDQTLPNLPEEIDIGVVHLVGAGAIGQAFLHALSAVAARGTLVVIDPQTITLSNLQRYILAGDSDIGLSKVVVAETALKGSTISVMGQQSSWELNSRERSSASTLCVAVDTEALRVAIQASLPRRIYNAWTQPADIGWSRHESFGEDPCLACLYWPTRARPNYHELIARALREHELRVLAYLSSSIPIDLPLLRGQIPQLLNLTIPPEAEIWLSRSLLEDVALRFALSSDDVQLWKAKTLIDLYHEGICGGALIRHENADLSAEVSVPLPQQSALAGIMLAVELLVSNCPELAPYRHPSMEARLDLLAGFPQIAARPRVPTRNCICSDVDFLARYAAKWPAVSG